MYVSARVCCANKHSTVHVLSLVSLRPADDNMLAAGDAEADEVMAAVAAMRRRDRALEAKLLRNAADPPSDAADEPATDSDDEAYYLAMTQTSLGEATTMCHGSRSIAHSQISQLDLALTRRLLYIWVCALPAMQWFCGIILRRITVSASLHLCSTQAYGGRPANGSSREGIVVFSKDSRPMPPRKRRKAEADQEAAQAKQVRC